MIRFCRPSVHRRARSKSKQQGSTVRFATMNTRLLCCCSADTYFAKAVSQRGLIENRLVRCAGQKLWMILRGGTVPLLTSCSCFRSRLKEEVYIKAFEGRNFIFVFVYKKMSYSLRFKTEIRSYSVIPIYVSCIYN